MGEARRAVLAALVLVSLSACGARYATDPGSVQTPVITSSTSPPTIYTPTSAAPEPLTCPVSGIRYGAGPVEAALGHRAVVLTLVNCGSSPRTITGYPEIHVLGSAGEILEVDVAHGSSYMAQDPGPTTVTLAPAEWLRSVVAWSATVTAGEPVTGSALAVTSVPGEKPQIMPVETDLGTTDEIDVTAWSAAIAE